MPTFALFPANLTPHHLLNESKSLLFYLIFEWISETEMNSNAGWIKQMERKSKNNEKLKSNLAFCLKFAFIKANSTKN